MTRYVVPQNTQTFNQAIIALVFSVIILKGQTIKKRERKSHPLGAKYL
jgi:hypothetical protein